MTQNQTVRNGSMVPVSVEVRDQYDNPVSGVRVRFDDRSTESIVRSQENGIATDEYRVSGSDSVDISIDTVDPEFDVDPIEVQFEIVS